jgi:hypothetical protein
MHCSIWGARFGNGWLPAKPPLERSEILRTPFTIDAVGLQGELQPKSVSEWRRGDGSTGSMILAVVVAVVSVGSDTASIFHNFPRLVVCIAFRKPIASSSNKHTFSEMHVGQYVCTSFWHRNRCHHGYQHHHSSRLILILLIRILLCIISIVIIPSSSYSSSSSSSPSSSPSS